MEFGRRPYNPRFAVKCDHIFPASEGDIAFQRVKNIYLKAGVGGNVRFVVGPGGHRFYPDLAGPVFDDVVPRYWEITSTSRESVATA